MQVSKMFSYENSCSHEGVAYSVLEEPLKYHHDTLDKFFLSNFKHHKFILEAKSLYSCMHNPTILRSTVLRVDFKVRFYGLIRSFTETMLHSKELLRKCHFKEHLDKVVCSNNNKILYHNTSGLVFQTDRLEVGTQLLIHTN